MFGTEGGLIALASGLSGLRTRRLIPNELSRLLALLRFGVATVTSQRSEKYFVSSEVHLKYVSIHLSHRVSTTPAEHVLSHFPFRVVESQQRQVSENLVRCPDTRITQDPRTPSPPQTKRESCDLLEDNHQRVGTQIRYRTCSKPKLVQIQLLDLCSALIFE